MSFSNSCRNGLYLPEHLTRVKQLEKNKKEWLKFFSQDQVYSLFSTGYLYLEWPLLNKNGTCDYSRIVFKRDYDGYSDYFSLKLEISANGHVVENKDLDRVLSNTFKFPAGRFSIYLRTLELNKSSYFYDEHPETMDILLKKTLDSLEF